MHYSYIAYDSVIFERRSTFYLYNQLKELIALIHEEGNFPIVTYNGVKMQVKSIEFGKIRGTTTTRLLFHLIDGVNGAWVQVWPGDGICLSMFIRELITQIHHYDTEKVLEDLNEIYKHDIPVAVGEITLPAHEFVLLKARELGIPVILHNNEFCRVHTL